MTEGIIVLFGIVAVVVWVSYLASESGNLRNDWRQAARDAGLQLVTEKTWGLVGLVGRAGEHRVLIDELRTRQGVTGTRIVIEGSSGITLSRETWNTAFEKKLGKREMQLGDEAFDREVYVRGSPEVLRALLDAEAREQLRRMLGGWIRIDGGSTPGFEAEVSLSGGHLQADFLAQWNEKLQVNLAEVLTALLAVARKLEPPADLAARIAALPRPKSASRPKPAPLPPEPPPLEIRELRRADGDALRRLWDAAGFRSVGDDDASLATFARRNPGLLLVATAGETIIASALGAWDGRRGWIYHVTTAAGHRRVGIARRLVTQIEERLIALGCPRVNVVVRDEDEAAPAFWRALGYSVTPSRHYGKDLAAMSRHGADTRHA